VRTGAFARECRVHGWESVKACLDATAKGYRTVVMPGQYFYFDMRQSPREDGHDWAAIFDAKKVYGFGFTEFSPEQMRNVEGLQGAFFSEAYVSHEPEKPDYLDYMLFPRVCALARIAWSGNAEGWDAYYEELKGKHYDRMAAMGIRFRLFPPKVGYGDGAFKDPVGKIWELADPCVSVANTEGLEGTPNEIKLKYLADNDFKDLSGEALKDAISERIREKEDNLVGNMASQGTTPRRLTDLIGSLCDLTSGSGDKGTPIILIQGYFDNFTD